MWPRLIISILLIMILLAGGVGAAALLIMTRPTPPAAEPVQKALIVRALRLESQTIIEPIEGYGTARADRYARISSQVAAEIVEVPEGIKDGADVEQGALLARLDERDYQQQLKRAESQLQVDEAELDQLDVRETNLKRLTLIAGNELRIADKEYNRLRELIEGGISDQRELDLKRLEYERARRVVQEYENQLALLPLQRRQREAEVARRQAEVQLARLDVERCRIQAPLSGRVDQLHVEVGERVQVGTLLLSLLDPVRIEVPIELPVSQRAKIQAGRNCRLYLDSRANAAWDGRVRRVAPRADETSRTFRLYVEVDNLQQADPLMPGMFVNALIEGPTLEQVLIVPRACILSDKVFLFDEGRARPRPVEVRQHILDQSVVRGLQQNEVVITSNLDSLHDGTLVEIGEWEENGVFLAGTRERLPRSMPADQTSSRRP